MNIFKRVFGKLGKKNKQQEPECWYNNFHEQKRSRWQEPIEGAAFSSPNQGDHNVARSISKSQG